MIVRLTTDRLRTTLPGWCPLCTPTIGPLAAMLKSTLGDGLVGLYAYGSAVSGGFDRPASDIDLVAEHGYGGAAHPPPVPRPPEKGRAARGFPAPQRGAHVGAAADTDPRGGPAKRQRPRAGPRLTGRDGAGPASPAAAVRRRHQSPPPPPLGPARQS